LAEGNVEIKALGRRGVLHTLDWNYHALGRTALLLDRVDEALIGASYNPPHSEETLWRRAGTL
jgi:hypothetical protein